MKVNGADDVGDWIKRRLRGRSWREIRTRRAAKKGVGDVAGNQNTLRAEIYPGVRKVGEVDAPVLGLLLDVRLKTEAIHAR